MIADQFFSDPSVNDAMATLLDRLAFYQTKLNSSQPAKKSQEHYFAKLINVMQTCRGPMYFPYLSSGMGHGPYVECADGSVKLDFISGIGVHWSHGDRKIVESSLKAALHDTVMQGNLQQHAGSVELYQQLSSLSGLDYVFLTSSGVMGVENALKICMQYRYPANRILAFSKCFCGRTLAAASITDKPGNREGLPLVLDVDYIPFYNPKKPKQSTHDAISQLESILLRYPDQHACMKFELIQGEGGFNVGSKPFFKAIIKTLNQVNIPVYVDETQTFGRTTSLFAFQLFDLHDDVDVVSIGKLSQVCATLYRKKFTPKPGLISQTFTSSTGAIEASKVILQALTNENYLGKHGKTAAIHGYFARKFRQLSKKYPDTFSDLRGVGSMIAFQVFQGKRENVIQFIHDCFDEGLICFIAGNNPTYVRFLLPIGGITNAHLDEAISIMERCIHKQKESQS